MRLLLTVTSCLLVLSLNAQMIGLTVEIDTVFYEATGPHPTTPDLLLFEDLDGYVTYDVYANLTNETDEIIAIYSDVEGLGVAPMFIDAPCGCFNPNFGAVLLGGSQNEAFFYAFPEIEYDTYWTIDLNDTEQSLISNPAYSTASMCSEIVEDGSIFVLPDNANAAGDDLRIKIARVTTCGGFSLSACFNVFVGGDNSNVQDYCIDENGSGPFFVSEGGIYGCTDELALNFDPTAFENDGSCTYSGAEYCGPGTIWDSATLRCLPSPNNCGAGTYWNQLEAQCLPFDNCPEDLDNDGNVAVPDLLILLSAYSEECPAVLGCTDMEAVNFNPNAQEDDGSCILTVLGCTLEAACNYNGLANLDDGTCLFEDECGVCGGGGLLDGACDCEGNFSVEFYDCDGECLFDSDGDGVCDELEVLGCTDSDAANFDSTATDDDGSCVIQGCTFPTACNYNPAADEDDGTCQSFDQCGVCGGSGFPLGTCNCEGTPPDSGYDCYGECLNDIDGDGVCDQFEVIGCDDFIACNYQANATDNDGSCVFPDEFYDCDGICLSDEDGDGVCDELEVGGCVDASACNYSNDATDDDGSCFYAQEFYDCLETCLGDADGDGVCDELEVSGCTDAEADNYDVQATDEDGSCIFSGCTDSDACNFFVGATIDDGSCIYSESYYTCEGLCISDSDQDGVCDELEVSGCTDTEAFNFEQDATEDDGSCAYAGCTVSIACNYNPLASLDDDSCEFYCPGCTDDGACNYDDGAIQDDGTCLFPEDLWGGTYFDCEGNCAADLDGDGVCDEDEIVGCQLEGACNYLAGATDEGDCEYESCVGCTYEFACNYDPSFSIADYSACEFGTCPGCTDPVACNFNPTVTEDDGSCLLADEFYDCAGVCLNDEDEDGVCDELEVYGCTDDMSCNYSTAATEDDQSCISIELIGTNCDDGDNNTINDVWNEITCSCAGVPYVAVDASGPCGGEEFIAYHDYEYKLVEIGSECWFAENLRSANYRNGDPIPEVESVGVWSSTTSGAQVIYDFDPNNLSAFGRIYNFYATDDPRGICPSGWHVPSHVEYLNLLYLQYPAGENLKSSPLDFPSWDGMNRAGFSALPGGYRNTVGMFGEIGVKGWFWSASISNNSSESYAHWLTSDYIYNTYGDRLPTYGASIRCLKN